MIEELRGFRRLASDRRSYVRLAIDVVGVRMLRLVDLGYRERTVQVGDGARLTYRLNRGDLRALAEIWAAEVYRLPDDLRPSTLIDFGANIGLSSVWLARRYGCRHVIAVEPSPDNVRLARRNLADNGVVGEVIEAAVGSMEGTARLQVTADSTLGQLGREGIAVSVVAAGSVAARSPDRSSIDLVKMDIEGGEENVLTRETEWLDGVRFLLAELHPDRVDVGRVLHCMRERGFEPSVQHVPFHERTAQDPLVLFRRRA